MQRLLRTIAVALVAFVAGFATAHRTAPVQAAATPIVPQSIDLAALTPQDLPAPATATSTTRSKVLVNADGMTLGVQIGPTPRHYHADANEFQYVVDGTGTEWLGDTLVTLKPGTLLIIPKGTPHGGLSDHVKLIAIKTPPQAPDDTHLIK